MKKLDTVLNLYFNRISVENLKALSVRLKERIGSDLAEALNEMQTCSDLDRWLSSAKSYGELYDLLDIIGETANAKLSERCPEGV